jgi:hypothetical protein
MCHMRRRIHVSYEEEDTSVIRGDSDYYHTILITNIVSVNTSSRRELTGRAVTAEGDTC